MNDEPEVLPPLPPAEESAVEKLTKKTPWWAISVGIHALAVLILTYLIVLSRPLDAEEVISVQKPRKLQPPPDWIEKIQPKAEVEIDVPEVRPVPAFFKDPTDDEKIEDDTKEEFEQAKGDSEKFISDKPFRGPQANDSIGGGGGGGGDYGGPFGGRKIRRPRGRGGVTKETEDAVLAALMWLARHQNPDGSWNVQGYTHQCGKKRAGTCTPNPSSADEEYNVGVTSLSLLAFLGAGYSHMSKDAPAPDNICFGEVVRKGLQWLMSQQDAEGCIGSRLGHKYMYNHSIASLALGEAYGLSGSTLFRDNAQRAIDFLVAAQNQGKGWRYSARSGDNDSSVTGWAVMALKSAEMSGLQLPRTSYDGARAWFDEVTEPSYARTGYTHRGTGKVYCGHNGNFEHHEALTAIAIMSKIFIDRDESDPTLRLGCDLMVRDLPKWEGEKIDFYYWYYASLALFQYDGPSGSYWTRWNEPMKEALVKNQNVRSSGCKDGSWEPVSRWSCEGGRVFAVAINALTLEVYYRYANVFGGGRK